ncbi:MAG: hypothetical protein ACREF1_08255 [Acetobacteraceae bacterium]
MAHHKTLWDAAGLSFEMVDDLTSDPVVTIAVETPDGTLRFMAEPEAAGATLILRGMHVHGASANAIGAANLMVVAQAVMERMNLDGLVVEGALRTTGANPGHRPRVLRFSRRVRPASAAGPRAA